MTTLPAHCPQELWQLIPTIASVARIVLQAMISAGANIDSKYQIWDECEPLCNSPLFRNMLANAVKSQDFSEVLRLRILQPKKVNMRFSEDVKASEKLATEHAWRLPFEGHYHQVLLRTISNMSEHVRLNQSYANYLPLVQSSGTGKSRTVDELAKSIFTIPFNVRDAAANIGYAYPPSDTSIVAFLIHTHFATWEDARNNYCVFFETLFSKILSWLNNKWPDEMFDTAQDLAFAWRRELARNTQGQCTREELYADVVRVATMQIGNVRDLDAEMTTQLEKRASKAGEELVSWIKIHVVGNQSQSPTMILYFDEAHTLTNATISAAEGGMSKSRFDALTSALNCFLGVRLFAIVLSTNSRMHGFSPAQEKHPSDRVRRVARDYLQAPYTELPFDCLQDDKPFIKDRQFTLSEACDLSVVCRFGRPLWLALYKQGNLDVRNSLISFALSKLTGFDNYYVEAGNPTQKTLIQLSVLSSRLLLDMEPRREYARHLETGMVEGHMRIAYSVPKHRQYMRSGYPSEPILAEAAAQVMEMWQGTGKEEEVEGEEKRKESWRVSDILSQHVRDGLISKGERGELVARLILIQAFDAASKKARANKGNDDDERIDRPVRLLDFLEALFGKTHMEAIKSSRPDNQPQGTTLAEAFEDAYVRFTHFARNEDETVTNTYGVWAAIMRGMAMQCSSNNPIIDIIIPIILRNEKLTENIMTAMLIQVRNRDTQHAWVIDQAELNRKHGFFPPSKDDKRPYITLVMQLGVETASSKRQYYDTAMANPHSSPSKLQTYKGHFRSFRSKKLTEDPGLSEIGHPRYAINVTGCSPSVYAVVDSKANYAYLLGGRDLYEEHPRQDPANLSLVQRLKPTWTLDNHCYDWIDNALLRNKVPGGLRSSDAPQLDDGALLVGRAAVTL
ncbi:uncharacterized protein FIBRA_09586 [Fibroporia radiculosa]|uniref:Uncharacterized protein n=1 Tax=Fibroporia radiculosa TaxID=599839 RepID=J7RWC8_9APHY|nr:uncharacterized protein FIBRA_09586 [Fibroporia radiculosa]CCM07240.1 predicted protein [Fibroporia radiculosa]